MSWVKIEDRHEAAYKRNFILCSEPCERKFMIDVIIETFSFLKRDYLEEAFDNCCQTMGPACERKKFLHNVKQLVGKKITVNYVKGYANF